MQPTTQYSHVVVVQEATEAGHPRYTKSPKAHRKREWPTVKCYCGSWKVGIFSAKMDFLCFKLSITPRWKWIGHVLRNYSNTTTRTTMWRTAEYKRLTKNNLTKNSWSWNIQSATQMRHHIWADCRLKKKRQSDVVLQYTTRHRWGVAASSNWKFNGHLDQ